MKNFEQWMECKNIEPNANDYANMKLAWDCGACEIFEALDDLGFLHDVDEAWESIKPIFDTQGD